MQGIEQALQQAVQQLAAMQVQQAQTEQQLHEAREAATAATAAAAAAGKGESEQRQAEVVSQGAPAAVVPMGSESIRACLVEHGDESLCSSLQRVLGNSHACVRSGGPGKAQQRLA